MVPQILRNLGAQIPIETVAAGDPLPNTYRLTWPRRQGHRFTPFLPYRPGLVGVAAVAAH
jgi:hypothetical protein